MKQHSEEEVASFDISRKLATLANIPEFHNYCEYFWIQDPRFEEEPDNLKLIPNKLVPVYTMKAGPKFITCAQENNVIDRTLYLVRDIEEESELLEA